MMTVCIGCGYALHEIVLIFKKYIQIANLLQWSAEKSIDHFNLPKTLSKKAQLRQAE